MINRVLTNSGVLKEDIFLNSDYNLVVITVTNRQDSTGPKYMIGTVLCFPVLMCLILTTTK